MICLSLLEAIRYESTKHLLLIYYSFGGFQSMGVPQKWLVYQGNSHLEMDDDWGYPHIHFHGNFAL